MLSLSISKLDSAVTALGRLIKCNAVLHLLHHVPFTETVSTKKVQMPKTAAQSEKLHRQLRSELHRASLEPSYSVQLDCSLQLCVHDGG